MKKDLEKMWFPDDILNEILSYLNIDDRIRLHLPSKKLNLPLFSLNCAQIHIFESECISHKVDYHTIEFQYPLHRIVLYRTKYKQKCRTEYEHYIMTKYQTRQIVFRQSDWTREIEFIGFIPNNNL